MDSSRHVLRNRNAAPENISVSEPRQPHQLMPNDVNFDTDHLGDEIQGFDPSEIDLDFQPWTHDGMFEDMSDIDPALEPTGPINIAPMQRKATPFLTHSIRPLLPNIVGDMTATDHLLNPNAANEILSPRRLKRKAQNRAAQQAFRARKEKYEKELRERVTTLETRCASLTTENEKLRQELSTVHTCFGDMTIHDRSDSESHDGELHLVRAHDTSSPPASTAAGRKMSTRHVDSALGSERSASPAASSTNEALTMAHVGIGPSSPSGQHRVAQYVLLRGPTVSPDDESDVLLLMPGSNYKGREAIRLTRQTVEVIELSRADRGAERGGNFATRR